jgi:hypothetical protein
MAFGDCGTIDNILAAIPSAGLIATEGMKSGNDPLRQSNMRLTFDS